MPAYTRHTWACPCSNVEPIAYDYIFAINVRGIGLYYERTRKVCMLLSSGSKGKDKAKETQKSFLMAIHVL